MKMNRFAIPLAAVGSLLVSFAAQAAFEGYSFGLSTSGATAPGNFSATGTDPLDLHLTSQTDFAEQFGSAFYTAMSPSEGTVRFRLLWTSSPTSQPTSPQDAAYFLVDINGDGDFDDTVTSFGVVRDERTALALNQSVNGGTYIDHLFAGHLFGFEITTDNSINGYNDLLLTDITAPVPEPSVMLSNGVIVLAISSLGYLQFRRKSNKA